MPFAQHLSTISIFAVDLIFDNLTEVWYSRGMITPDWVAKDMVRWFRPTGRVLDPCTGGGVFLRYISAEWCEIDRGRDFFAWGEQVDWVIGNPPYPIFREWLVHSYEIAENIVYLVPSYKVFNTLSMFRVMRERGMIKHIRVYDTGKKIPWARGRPIVAAHFVRGYDGGTSWSFYS